jgi:hypothetical protein
MTTFMAVCTFKDGTDMADWWDIDLFPIDAPAIPGAV